MTFGMGCFIGTIYLITVIASLRFRSLRNAWSFNMLFYGFVLAAIGLIQLIMQLPWIILAIGAASIPFAIAIRIAAPVFLSKQPYIEVLPLNRSIVISKIKGLERWK